MRGLVVLFQLCVLPLLASAGGADGNFWLPADLPADSRPQNYERASSASVAIAPASAITPNSSRAYCSGTFVSNEGHILTARHCFEQCLRHLGALHTRRVGRHVYVIDIDPAQALSHQCEVVVEGAKVFASIVAVSAGWLQESGFGDFNPREPRDSLEYWRAAKATLPAAHGFTSDYIMFKTDLHPIACAPVAKVFHVKSPSTLWAIGMPSATARPGLRNSDGIHKYISTGAYCGSQRSDADYLQLQQAAKPNSPPAPEYGGLTSTEFLETVATSTMNGAGTFFHSATTYQGNSGGGVFDQRGELTAISVANTQSPFDDTDLKTSAPACTSMALSLERITGLMSQQIGVDKTQQAFACTLPSGPTN